MPVLAECTQCSKTYRVPHRDKQWNCKVCRDPLIFVDDEPSEPEETECPSCGALFFGEESFCAECGESLDLSKEVLEGNKRQAAAELRRAMKRVSRFSIFVTYNLVMSLLATPVILAAAVFGDSPPGLRIFLVALQVVSVGLAIFCRIHFDRRPFPIIVALASVQTLFGILAFVQGDGWIPSAVWAAILWLLSADAAQVARLVRQHPDLYLSKRMRGEHLTRRGKEPREESPAQRRIRQDRSRASRKFWTRVGIGAGASIVAAIAFVAYKAATAPPSPEATITRFQAAWNAGDSDRVLDAALRSKRETFSRQLKRIDRKYEWNGQFPPLDTAEWKLRDPRKVKVRYQGEAGPLVVLFQFEDEHWGFVQIDPRKVKSWRPGE